MNRRIVRGLAGSAGTLLAVALVMAIPFPDLHIGMVWVLLTIAAGLVATVIWAGGA